MYQMSLSDFEFGPKVKTWACDNTEKKSLFEQENRLSQALRTYKDVFHYMQRRDETIQKLPISLIFRFLSVLYPENAEFPWSIFDSKYYPIHVNDLINELMNSSNY